MLVTLRGQRLKILYIYIYIYIYINICNILTLTPGSDQHQITPYRITPDIHHIGSKV